jgi:glycine cleavage system pyridoxal-binding protein P
MGKNPRKVKADVSVGEATTVGINAVAHGSTSYGICAEAICEMNSFPGSLSPGVPASHTSQTSFSLHRFVYFVRSDGEENVVSEKNCFSV